MFINPMQPLQRIDGVNSSGLTQSPSGVSSQNGAAAIFRDFLQESISGVIETDAAVKADTFALATGQTDDLHTLTIDQTKAQISIELLVQMRNRLLDSYNEIMRINL